MNRQLLYMMVFSAATVIVHARTFECDEIVKPDSAPTFKEILIELEGNEARVGFADQSREFYYALKGLINRQVAYYGVIPHGYPHGKTIQVADDHAFVNPVGTLLPGEKLVKFQPVATSVFSYELKIVYAFNTSDASGVSMFYGRNHHQLLRLGASEKIVDFGLSAPNYENGNIEFVLWILTDKAIRAYSTFLVPQINKPPLNKQTKLLLNKRYRFAGPAPSMKINDDGSVTLINGQGAKKTRTERIISLF